MRLFCSLLSRCKALYLLLPAFFVISCAPSSVTDNGVGKVPVVTGSCVNGPTSSSANIFNVNPITSSGNNSLSLTANLNPYISGVTVDGLDGTCLLQNNHFRIVSDSMYSSTIALPSNGLVYLPTDPRFQQVMAYHFSNQLRKKMATVGADISALGMVTIDAHCNVSNNAYYSPSSKALCFGYTNPGAGKKVWAADDADVVVHEAGHSINHTLASSSIMNSSGEAGAMDEAIADYWAATLNQNSVISEWFLGAIESIYNITGVVRDSSQTHAYPDSMVYEVHDDSRVFSELLWDIRTNLGAAKTDQLVAVALTMLPSTSRFRDGAVALQDAALALSFSLADRNLINNRLTAKGFLRTDSAASIRISTVGGTHKQVYVIDDHTLTNQSGGNCNASLDVGETALIVVNFENTSASIMGASSLSLSTVPAGITVPTGGGVGEIFRLNANADFTSTLMSANVYTEDATIAAGFLVTASSAGVKNFSATYTPMGGASSVYNFSLTVGTVATSASCTNASLWP